MKDPPPSLFEKNWPGMNSHKNECEFLKIIIIELLSDFSHINVILHDVYLVPKTLIF